MTVQPARTVVLAAGAGRRLGTVAKALLRLRGDSFLAAVTRVAAAAGAPVAVVVVAEPHRAVTEDEARRLGLETVVNPDPSRGMASSVAVAFSAVEQWRAGAHTALLWPVDHARVQVDTARQVVAAATHDNIVIPTYGGRGGHPTAFGREMWAALAQCDAADDGARSVVRAHAGNIVRIPVADPGVTRDVDTPADRSAL